MIVVDNARALHRPKGRRGRDQRVADYRRADDFYALKGRDRTRGVASRAWLVMSVALVPAAGRGLRMGGPVPKQFLSLGGEPLVIHSLRVLQASAVVDHIILAVPAADIEYCSREIVSRHRFTKVTKVVAGGEERQDSVRQALAAVSPETEIVLVHDAVRPFLTERMINEVVSRCANPWRRDCGASDARHRQTCSNRPNYRAYSRSHTLVACADSASLQAAVATGCASESPVGEHSSDGRCISQLNGWDMRWRWSKAAERISR